MDLPIIWACIIAFSLMMYVILDGFDLGVGLLFSVFHDKHDRDLMMSTVLPVWDGNETWLVMGAASIYGAFPIAYSTLLPMFYLPIFIMLAALVFRGVSFEFRFKATSSRWIWDGLFFLGSFTAAFIQGVLLGAFVKGVHLPPVGDPPAYQWVSLYSAFCGITAVSCYMLMGAAWLIRKTEGPLRDNLYHSLKVIILISAILLFIMSVWTLVIDPYITPLWLNTARMPFMFIIPFLAILTFLCLLYGIFKKKDRVPFYSTIVLFFFVYVGFIINVWPYAIPRVVTFREAASPPVSQGFMLIGAVILLPVLLFYTFYSYHIFRGKVKDVHEY